MQGSGNEGDRETFEDAYNLFVDFKRSEESRSQKTHDEQVPSNSHGARPVHLIIMMIKSIRTSRLSIKNSLPDRGTGRSERGRYESERNMPAKRGKVGVGATVESLGFRVKGLGFRV